MRRNPVLDIVTRELRGRGIPYTTEHRGSTHIAVHFLGRMQIVSASPSAQDARWQARSDTRRIIRQTQATM